MFGSMIKIKERKQKMLTRTVTAKAEEISIKDDEYVPPSGHLSFVKNRSVVGSKAKAQILTVGGARMEDGRTWKTASTIMSRTIEIDNDRLNLGELTHLKSIQLTSSHKNKTTKGSVLPCLTNSAGVDLSSPVFDELDIIIYGGQFTDRVVTSDDVITIKGSVTENLNDSKIDVTKYPSKLMDFKEFNVPRNWKDGSEQVQQGSIPSSRTGHTLSKWKCENGSHLLVSIGGHSKPSLLKPFYHPKDSINILQAPEMKWRRLQGSEAFERSFHGQSVNSRGEILLLGGQSLISGRWSRIHPLNEVLVIKINEDFSYTVQHLNFISDIPELKLLTNFSFFAQADKMFVFSGFKFPNYNDNNLFKFLPPNTSKDFLPEFGNCLYIFDINSLTISNFVGPANCGSYNGSIALINDAELVIMSDPSIFLYSERRINSLKCDLDEKFGCCSLALAEKRREIYNCSTPVCNKRIHVKCDKSLRGKMQKPSNNLCPTCNNLDSVTWKRIKTVSFRK